MPEDVSVVGFDGLALGSYLVPRLSTVTQPVEQMARRGVEILISRIEEAGGAVHEMVPFELLTRESLGKPKSK